MAAWRSGAQQLHLGSIAWHVLHGGRGRGIGPRATVDEKHKTHTLPHVTQATTIALHYLLQRRALLELRAKGVDIEGLPVLGYGSMN